MSDGAAASGSTSAGAVDAVLEWVANETTPLRSQVMEYSGAPSRSSLQFCGIRALETGLGPKVLLEELRERGLDEAAAEVGAATLCLMLGGIDEAHNLVTPHSWPSPTSFGGPPKLGSPMRQEAAYIHMLVHRMEGLNVGEFGTGFNNSGFWMGQAFAGVGQHPIFPSLRMEAERLSQDHDQAAAELCKMGQVWIPSFFNRTCEIALSSKDSALMAFCAKVHRRELELLFQHILGTAEKA